MTTIRLNSETSRKHIMEMLAHVPTDKNMQVKIEKIKRTTEQNDKWHTMVADIGSHFGYTRQEMKYILKDELGLYHDVEGKTKTVRVYHETSSMAIDALSELIEQTYAWAAGHGLVLP